MPAGLQAQSTKEPGSGEYIPQPVAPSPTAASLGKFGEIPVSLYTGVPDISIPIWTVKEGDINLNISAAYHSGGVKVEEDASWIGLGWALNAGGVITRSVRGKPDDEAYLIAAYPKIPDLLLNPDKIGVTPCEAWEGTKFARLVGRGLYDGEPDSYYFNFNGLSGQFVFDQNGIPYTIPYQKLKIERLSKVDWVITTTDGTRYKFGGDDCSEYTQAYSVVYPYYDWGISEKNKDLVMSHYSSWYLKEIESPNGRKVSFEYSDENYQVNSGISQFVYYELQMAPIVKTPDNSSTLSDIKGKRLKRIIYSDGSVSFITDKDREDVMNGQPAARVLGRIEIADAAGNPVKSFVFNTDYFKTAGAPETYLTKRLRLNSIVETAANGIDKAAPYEFTYDAAFTLPAKNSSSQDHWGFFNGKRNKDQFDHPILVPSIVKGYTNETFIGYFDRSCRSCPVVECKEYPAGCVQFNTGLKNFEFNGADRSADFGYAKTGILTAIKYPTGGNTVFEYEPHDYELPNKVYKVVTISNNVLAACHDPNNPPTIDGNTCYVKKSFTPKQSIPADLQPQNTLVPFDLSLAVRLDGNDNKCCKCGAPYAYFKDVTTGKLLIEVYGFSGLSQDPIIDEAIKNGGATFRQGTNVWYFNNVRLEAGHTYEVYARTIDCPPERCGEVPGCPPNQSPRMESYINASFSYRTNEVEAYNGTSSGLRIKRITSNTGPNDTKPVIKQFVYRMSESKNLVSSGVLIDVPIYYDFYTKKGWVPLGQTDVRLNVFAMETFDIKTKLISLTSGSKFALGQSHGSFISYREVQEISCLDNNCTGIPQGRKVTTFTSAADYPDPNAGVFGYVWFPQTYPDNSCPDKFGDPRYLYDWRFITRTAIDRFENYFPYPQKNSMDWKRGLVQQELTYDNQNNLVMKVEYKYNDVADNNNRKVISGLKISRFPLEDEFWKEFRPVGYPPDVLYVKGSHLLYGRYDIIAAWNYLAEKKVTEYHEGFEPIVNSTKYFYDNPVHAQTTRIEQRNSKNENISVTMKYPLDYTISGAATTPASKGISLLQEKFIVTPVVEKITRLSNEDGSNSRVTKGTYVLFKPDQPLPDIVHELNIASGLTDFKAASITATAATIDDRYNPIHSFYKYNAGNVLEYGKVNDVKTVYLWGYKNQQPVAKIIGADYNTVKQYVSQAILDNPPNDQRLRDELNNIRTALPDALVTTYTYHPLFGMTSETGPNKQTVYYEYDGLGRLKLIKDQNGKIVKQFEYQYQRPVTE
ncbi:hypothetical protein DF182_31950 [Chitinophaga flava]|uniref:YD repeat-containing protein n=1 Tax=Chitinophaga flava TaxID=2259036 RepID=A0A365XRD8_9BACT|nr:hypothetical protein DF182_31950 [Chitinophaga flava]